MTLFWLGAVCLAALALFLVVLPWVKTAHRSEQDKLTNTQIIKARINELTAEVQEGLISEQDKQQAIDELKLALLDETTPSSAQSPKAVSSMPAVALALVAVVLGSAIYLHSNEINSIVHWQGVTEQSQALANRIVIEADPTVTTDDLQDFALAMRTRLNEKPDDAIGWLLLGRIHASTQRLDSAIEAFERALQLDPNHLGILSSYSQALLMTGQEQSVRQAQGLLRRSLELDPNDINALGMLAVTTTQLGEDQQAISLWQQLKQKLPENDSAVAQINKRIDTLKGTTSGQTSVLITISIDDSLSQKLPDSAFLFVFAQDPSAQAKMPAAVVKMPLPALPLQVSLSDANAMIPTYTLSQLSQVRLVARISADENVAQAQGELQGEANVTLQPGSQITQTIKIDKELM